MTEEEEEEEKPGRLTKHFAKPDLRRRKIRETQQEGSDLNPLF